MMDILERLRVCAKFDPDQADAIVEIERLREALHAIVCNTEPSAIKHRDYDHLAQSIYACARAALGEDK